MISVTTRLFVISLGTLAMLHFLSIKMFLYWRYLWIDMPIHFFGGAVVALGVYAAHDLKLPVFRRITQPMMVLGIVCAVAVGWELFEYCAGISIVEKYFWRDTLSDLALGLIGGAFGTLLGSRLQKL